MVGQSLERNGAGRSIVTDRAGNIIAGNLTAEEAQARGIPFREVHTDGTELVVVVRDDLEPGSVRAQELALADNRAAEVSLDWDTLVLEDYKASGVPTDLYWFEPEWDALLAADDGPFGDEGAEPAEPLPEDAEIRVCFEMDAATFDRWTTYRDEWLAAGLAHEGEVLKHLLSQVEGV